MGQSLEGDEEIRCSCSLSQSRSVRFCNRYISTYLPSLRRRGALTRVDPGALSPLPNYIAVRTPSPFRSLQPDLQQLVNVRSPSPFQLEPPGPLAQHPTEAGSRGDQPQSLPMTPSSMNICTGNLKVGVRYLEKLHGMQLTQRLVSSMHRPIDLDFNLIDGIDMPLHLVPSAIEYPYQPQNDLDNHGLLPDPTNRALTRNFDPYHYLSIAVYLLSNNLANLDDNTSFSEWLETFTRRIPQSLLLEVMQIAST